MSDLDDPLAYPWTPAPGPGLVRGPGALGLPGEDTYALMEAADLDTALARHARTGLAGRVVVAGVGSNTSPAVLRAKMLRLGADPVIPLAPAAVGGLGVGHSAHVSARGYVAAAAYRAAGPAPVVLAWLDPEQLACLDRTEPTYRRVRLDPAAHPVRCAGGLAVGPVHVYDSHAGVLAGRDGGPLPFGPQDVALRRVAEVCGLPPQAARAMAARLAADPEARHRARAAIAAAGAALRSGLA